MSTSNQQNKLANILLAPVISEKSTSVAESNNIFIFKVRKDSKKLEIKKAVEYMFEVKVDSVQVLNMKGKAKRVGRYLGKQSDWKKAYIKLRAGHDIDFATA